MKRITNFLLINIGISCLILACASSVLAQNYRYSSLYRVDLSNATQRPQLGGMPSVNLPKEAIKNGLEGTLIAVMTLAKDGTIKDTKFEKTLPFGVEDAFINAYKTFKFKPAKRNGEPIDCKFTVTFIVSAIYDERDKRVKKTRIIDKPNAIYPPSLKSEARKGSVHVLVLFSKGGTMKIMGVNSTMPKEFDKAAVEAAKKIKFEPATHKKGKQAVSMTMTIEYKFKSK